MQMHREVDNKEFYHNRLNLVEQDGWTDLVQELKNLEDITNKLDSVENEKDLWFARGQLSILRQVIALEEMTKLAVEELDL
jgi:hypothetical protein